MLYRTKTGWCVSWNEGKHPNFHISYHLWGNDGLYFYFCPAEGFRWSKFRIIYWMGKFRWKI